MLQDEYFVLERENNDNYPLFSWDESSGQYGMGKPVVAADSVKLRLGEPISPNFEWVDCHKLPEPVFSKLIADALIAMDIYGVQLVPAEVRNPKDPQSEVRDYWYFHVWNSIRCLDLEDSEVEFSRIGKTIFGIDKLVLDESVLNELELTKRLVFTLAEDVTTLLIHQSVKEAIMSVSPKGCRFFKATEWNSDISFS